MNTRTRLATSAIALGAIAIHLGSCGAALPGSKAKNVDPASCGSYASGDTGKKVKAFLEATVELNEAVLKAENYFLDTCKEMGAELGVAPDGDTKTVCNAVSVALQEHLEVGIKAEAKAELDFKPAVCEVNMDIAAEVAAECEGKAEADIGLTCDGQCSGTCTGGCDGTCEGSTGTDGSSGDCAGVCDGVCKGRCEGGCDGGADVDASVSCRAKAQVSANVKAKCEPPSVKFEASADIIVDTSKVEAAQRAIDLGLGRILAVQRRATKPLRTAFAGWLKATAEMSTAIKGAADEFGKQSLCVAGQLRAALDMQARLKGSISIQVEASASIRGSAGAGRGEKDAE